jgi:hypothetical protein
MGSTRSMAVSLQDANIVAWVGSCPRADPSIRKSNEAPKLLVSNLLTRSPECLGKWEERLFWRTFRENRIWSAVHRSEWQHETGLVRCPGRPLLPCRLPLFPNHQRHPRTSIVCVMIRLHGSFSSSRSEIVDSRSTRGPRAQRNPFLLHHFEISRASPRGIRRSPGNDRCLGQVAHTSPRIRILAITGVLSLHFCIPTTRP